jgi:hypothetical protein
MRPAAHLLMHAAERLTGCADLARSRCYHEGKETYDALGYLAMAASGGRTPYPSELSEQQRRIYIDAAEAIARFVTPMGSYLSLFAVARWSDERSIVEVQDAFRKVGYLLLREAAS